MTPLDFAKGLLDRGIELIIRNGRLYVWPGRAHKYGLSFEEREYIHANRGELKAQAAAKVLPETTVVWQPPKAKATATRESTSSPVASCSYCGRPCVGPNHHAYRTLHYRDPAEIARRDDERRSCQ